MRSFQRGRFFPASRSRLHCQLRPGHRVRGHKRTSPDSPPAALAASGTCPLAPLRKTLVNALGGDTCRTPNHLSLSSVTETHLQLPFHHGTRHHHRSQGWGPRHLRGGSVSPATSSSCVSVHLLMHFSNLRPTCILFSPLSSQPGIAFPSILPSCPFVCLSIRAER